MLETIDSRLASGVRTKEELQRVYGVYPAGYDSVEEWWDDLVEPALAARPDVVEVENGWKLADDTEG